MIARQIREAQRGGRNMKESHATFNAAATVMGNILKRKRKGFKICRCARGGALLPFPAGRSTHSVIGMKIKLIFSAFPSNYGFIKSRKMTNVFFRYRYSPTLEITTPRYSHNARFVCRRQRQVTAVSNTRNASKVQPAIIRPIPIDMVDLIRVGSCHHFPDDAVGSISAPINPSDLIAISAKAVESRLARILRVPAFAFAGPPEKTSCLRVISETLVEIFGVWQGQDSHCEASFRGGQGRALFPQRSRPALHGKNPLPPQLVGDL